MLPRNSCGADHFKPRARFTLLGDRVTKPWHEPGGSKDVDHGRDPANLFPITIEVIIADTANNAINTNAIK